MDILVACLLSQLVTHTVLLNVHSMQLKAMGTTALLIGGHGILSQMHAEKIYWVPNSSDGALKAHTAIVTAVNLHANQRVTFPIKVQYAY